MGKADLWEVQLVLEFCYPPLLLRHYYEEIVLFDNLLVRNLFIIVMIRWTGLAPWGFEFPFPGSLTPTFLDVPRGCGAGLHALPPSFAPPPYPPAPPPYLPASIYPPYLRYGG